MYSCHASLSFRVPYGRSSNYWWYSTLWWLKKITQHDSLRKLEFVSGVKNKTLTISRYFRISMASIFQICMYVQRTFFGCTLNFKVPAILRRLAQCDLVGVLFFKLLLYFQVLRSPKRRMMMAHPARSHQISY